MFIGYSSGANISWEENMFNYYIKTIHRIERGIRQLGQGISTGICELKLWMFSSLLIYMNGLCEKHFHRCWYEWNRWMFSLLFACMNGLFECFLNRWFTWMESVNVFFIICWHKWNMWMCLLFVYVNVTFECILYAFFYMNVIL